MGLILILVRGLAGVNEFGEIVSTRSTRQLCIRIEQILVNRADNAVYTRYWVC